MQHMGVQHVALDPFAAVDQPAQIGDRLRDLPAQRGLHGLAGAHDVGDRTDAADPRGDVRGVTERAAPQQALEIARRLEDAELRADDLVALQPDLEPALALDPRQGLDLDGTRIAHS